MKRSNSAYSMIENVERIFDVAFVKERVRGRVREKCGSRDEFSG